MNGSKAKALRAMAKCRRTITHTFYEYEQHPNVLPTTRMKLDCTRVIYKRLKAEYKQLPSSQRL